MWPKKGMTQSLWPTEYMYAVKVFLIYSDNVLMYIAKTLVFPEHRPHGICITVHSRRVQGACCLDIGLRHMFSAHDGAAFR